MPQHASVTAYDALFIGLMSGTSIDAIDCALVKCSGSNFDLVATHSHPITNDLRARIGEISHTGADEIERMGALDRELGNLFAEAALQLLASSNTEPQAVTAIGSHGQTIRHRPPSAPGQNGQSFTLQIADPNTIAEITGITTVADFRRRDIAAGGEGAPLAPAFHAAAFAVDGVNRAIVNIGGLANISLLEGKSLLCGFDTGPGNTLLDHWVRRHRDELFDNNGQWAASGHCDLQLLEQLMSYPYFQKIGPKSTGKEEFNLPWLDAVLSRQANIEPANVQATLLQLTVASITKAIDDAAMRVQEVFICGGGAHNGQLMGQLQASLSPTQVASTADLGIDPDWVEAATFAWLASRTLSGLAGNAPSVTGATAPRVLGAIYPG